jgi:hypothetical protein
MTTVVGSVAVEVVADLSKLDAGLAQAQQKAGTAAGTIATGFNAVGASASTAGTATAQLAQHINNVSQTTATAASATSKMAQATQAVNMAQNAGTASAKNMSFQIKNLTFQLNDVATMALSGSSAFQILATQGGQIIQILGETGLKGAFLGIARGIASIITPLTVMGTLLVGTVGAALFSWMQFRDLQIEVGQTMEGLGRRTGLTSAAVLQFAKDNAEAMKLSVREVVGLTVAYSRMGTLSAENVNKLSGVTKDFAATLGVDVATAKEHLAKLFTDPAGAIGNLQRQFALLNGSEQRHVQNLIEQGRVQEAVSLVLDKLPDSLAKYEKGVTAISGAWEQLSRKVSDANLALGEWLSNQSKASDEVRARQAEATAERIIRTRETMAKRPWDHTPTPSGDASFAQTTDILPPKRVEELTGELEQAAQAAKKLKDHMEEVASTRLTQDLLDKADAARKVAKEFGDGTEEAIKWGNAEKAIRSAISEGNEAFKQHIANQGIDIDTAERLQHARETFLTVTQREADQREIDIQRERARTEEERKSVAARQARLDQSGRMIASEAAESNIRHATNMETERTKRLLEDISIAQRNQREGIELETRALFMSDIQRAELLAKLKLEQELRAQLGPQLSADAKRRVEEAGAIARQRAELAQFKKIADDISGALTNAFQNLASNISAGLKPIQALEQAVNSLGKALVSAGISTIAKSGGDPITAGIGAAEVGVGAVLQLFGRGESAAHKRRMQLIEAMMQQQKELQAKMEQAAKDAENRTQGFIDRLFAAQIDTSTQAGTLAAFEHKAQRDREAEIKSGGEAMVQLEAAIVAERVNLMKSFEEDAKQSAEELDTALNDLRGQGFINQIMELRKVISTMRTQGLDPTKIDQFFALSAQKIVDESEVVDVSFQNLLKTFPDLSGVIHEFTKATEDDARALEEAKKATADAVTNIARYLSDLVTGPESGLTGMERLAAAQATYQSQLRLAQQGNADALAHITQDFENLRLAAKDVYASGQGYQDILTQGIQDLLNLPQVQASIDPVVQQLLNVVDAVNQNRLATERILTRDQLAALGLSLDETTKQVVIKAGTLLTETQLRALGLSLDTTTGQVAIKAGQLLTENQMRALGLSLDATTGQVVQKAGTLLTEAQLNAMGLSKDVTTGQVVTKTGALLTDAQLAAMGLSKDATTGQVVTKTGALLTDAQLAAMGLSKDVTTGQVATKTGALLTEAQLNAMGLSKDATTGGIKLSTDRLLTDAQLNAMGLSKDVTTGQIKTNTDVVLTQAQLSAMGLSKDVTTGQIKASTDLLLTDAELRNIGLARDVTTGNIVLKTDELLTSAELAALGLSRDVTTGALAKDTTVLTWQQVDNLALSKNQTTANVGASVDAGNTIEGQQKALLDSLKALGETSRDHLAIIRDANTQQATIFFSASGGTVNVQNNMLTALNKIVANTYATAYNTFTLAERTSVATSQGARFLGTYATGGWIEGERHSRGGTMINAEEGEFMVRRSVAQSNPWLDQFNRTGDTPAEGNSGVAIEIRTMHYGLRTALAYLARELGSKVDRVRTSADRNHGSASQEERVKGLKTEAVRRRTGGKRNGI